MSNNDILLSYKSTYTLFIVTYIICIDSDKTEDNNLFNYNNFDCTTMFGF